MNTTNKSKKIKSSYKKNNKKINKLIRLKKLLNNIIFSIFNNTQIVLIKKLSSVHYKNTKNYLVTRSKSKINSIQRINKKRIKPVLLLRPSYKEKDHQLIFIEDLAPMTYSLSTRINSFQIDINFNDSWSNQEMISSITHKEEYCLKYYLVFLLNTPKKEKIKFNQPRCLIEKFYSKKYCFIEKKIVIFEYELPQSKEINILCNKIKYLPSLKPVYKLKHVDPISQDKRMLTINHYVNLKKMKEKTINYLYTSNFKKNNRKRTYSSLNDEQDEQYGPPTLKIRKKSPDTHNRPVTDSVTSQTIPIERDTDHIIQQISSSNITINQENSRVNYFLDLNILHELNILHGLNE